MSPTKQPIGVFDSGIGGLTALRQLAALLPDEDLLYLGDTARVPYGNRSAETIIEYAKECVNFLLQHSVKQILVACNTVSAVALPALQQMSPVPVIGVIKPAADVVVTGNYQRVGVIGTRTTIQSHSYQTAIAQQQAAIAVYSQACPLFVPIIEEGWQEHAAAYAIVKEYLAPLKAANVQALILGCTHYSFITQAIRTELPAVDLIDSGIEAAKLVAQQNIRTTAASSSRAGKINCYVTDLTPNVSLLAQQFLGLAPELLQQVDL